MNIPDTSLQCTLKVVINDKIKTIIDAIMI